jgi:hypothetical protein
MLQNLGYIAMPSAGECGARLGELLPILKGNSVELRQWTVRFSKACVSENALNSENGLNRQL